MGTSKFNAEGNASGICEGKPAELSAGLIGHLARMQAIHLPFYRKGIRKQIRPSCRKILRVRLVFVWFRESNEI